MKYVFGIDIDEVLRSTLSKMVEVYNREFHDNKQMKDIHSFVVEESFPRITQETGIKAGDWFFQLHSKEIFEDAEMLFGVLEAIEILKKFGEIIIVSYQKTPLNKKQAIDWLDKHGITYDGLCFLKNKSIVHVDYFIDDNDWNFKKSTARIGILIKAPYNKGVNVEELKQQSYCDDIQRFDSLYDFAKYFEHCHECELYDCR